MDSTRETIDDIVLVSQRLINALARSHTIDESIATISRIRLAGDLQKIVASSLAIADILQQLTDYADLTLDERLNDWITSQEPAACKEVLDTMAEFVGVDREDNSVWRWFLVPCLPTQAKVQQAVTLFNKRKRHFYFLLTTNVWNLEDHVKHILDSGAPTHTIDLVKKKIAAPSNVSCEMRMDVDTTQYDGAGKIENDEIDWKKLEDVLEWIDGVNCVEKHEITLDQRQDGTCEWLPNVEAYSAWRRGDYLFLWLHGKPGAGKSVLAASVIDSLHRSLQNEEFLVYFYCDFRSERTADAVEVLRSLLSQLLNIFLDEKIDPGEVFYNLLKEKRRTRSILNNAKHLAHIVSSAAKQFSRKPFVVIDALDECKNIQTLLDALVILNQGDLRLFVISRPRQIIKDRLYDLPSLSLDHMSIAISADIRLHVTREIDADIRLRIAPAKLKAEIQFDLCKKADGMFRWIECQLDALKRCVTPSDIRETLENLPNGLEETYDRILLEIDKHEHEAEIVRRALTWLIASFSRLQLAEIMEALSIDLDERILNPGRAPMHGQALLDALSSLVIHNEETDIVTLSHFSVQEYLTGELAHPKLSAYHIDPYFAEGQLAELCMCYIATQLNHGQRPGRSAALPGLSDGGTDRIMSPGISAVGSANPALEPHPLLQYVLSYTFSHISLANPANKTILQALQALERDVKRNPSTWDQMCKERWGSVGTWPSSRDDIALYILIAYAHESLLRSFLGPGRIDPKTGANALVYAAQLNRVAHVKSLLSRGISPNHCGRLAHRARLVTPLEAAVRHKATDIVEILLLKEITVPKEVFEDVFKAGIMGSEFDTRTMAKLLHTNHFVEWIIESENESIFFKFFNEWACELSTRLIGQVRPEDEDIVAILRRLVQVGWDPLAHVDIHRGLFLRVAIEGHISTLRYLLAMDILPPPDILLKMLTKTEMNSSMLQLLINHKADIHATTSEEHTALHVAINHDVLEEQCLQMVQLLVNAGLDPSAYDLHGETPLGHAASCGFTSVVKLLLSRRVHQPLDILLSCIPMQPGRRSGSMAEIISYLVHSGVADVHAAALNGDTALHTVLHSSWAHKDTDHEDCLESTKVLVKAGCNPCLVNSVGDSPLDVALWTGHVSIVEYFLTLGLPLPPDALLWASSIKEQSPNSVQMIKLLLDNKQVNVGFLSSDGNNPIHLAIRSTSKHLNSHHAEPTVKMLVDAGCSPSAQNTAGQTPLHLAVEYGYKSITAYFLSLNPQLPRDILFSAVKADSPELFTYLIERGADVRAIAKNGDTVLHGIMHSTFLRESSASALKLTKVVIQRGCNPRALNSAGVTPFQIAVRRGLVSVVEYLSPFSIPLPSSIMLDACRPRPSLDLRRYRPQIVRSLIAKGASVEAVTEKGENPLHLVLLSGDLQSAKLLIGEGLDPRAQNSLGETALHVAARRGYKPCMEYLLSLRMKLDSNLLLAQAKVSHPTSDSKESVMRWLINEGANIHAVTQTGDSVLHLTLGCNFEEARLQTARLLIELGCDPSRPNLTGETPLHVAAKSGFPSLIKLILSSQNGVLKPLPHDTLLSAASALYEVHVGPNSLICPRMTATFRLLIREGASVNVVASNGDTLLHIVVSNDLKTKLAENEMLKGRSKTQWSIVAILLSEGCDPFARNANGRTPFDLAQGRGYFFHNNFLRLVNKYYVPSRSTSERRRSSEEISGLKRQAEETNWNMETDAVTRQTKRGRWDDAEDENEIAEVEGQLMVQQ